MLPRHSSPKSSIPWIIGGGALIAGAILRFYMTYVVFRPSEHIFSDMQGYVTLAQRLLSPNHILNSFDLIQPLGTGLLLAGSFRLTGGLHAADALWLFMSIAAPVFWFIAARKMAGPVLAAAVAVWASLDFSMISFGSLFMSETPFAFFIAAGTACLAMAMTSQGRFSKPWSFAAGILWGISLLFRPHGICMLFMVVAITGIGIWNRRRDKNAVRHQAETAVAQTLLPFLFIAAIFAGYFSFKSGRPMLTSLGAGCQMVMGRLPDAAESRFEEPGTGIFHFYGSPVAHQRNPKGKFKFDFSIVDNAAAMKEAMRMFGRDPVQYLTLSFKNANDSIFGNDPWPANQMPTATLLKFYEVLFLLFGIIPALALVFPPFRIVRGSEVLTASLALPLLGLWLLGFVAIGETRYRIPFDGLIIIMACMKWGEILEWIREWVRNNQKKTSTAS